jgi:hypothetical protein
MSRKMRNVRSDDVAGIMMNGLIHNRSRLIRNFYEKKHKDAIEDVLKNSVKGFWKKGDYTIIEGGMKHEFILMMGATLLGLYASIEAPLNVGPEVIKMKNGTTIILEPGNTTVTKDEVHPDGTTKQVVLMDGKKKSGELGIFSKDGKVNDNAYEILAGIFNETDDEIVDLMSFAYQPADFNSRLDTEGNPMPLVHGLLPLNVLFHNASFLDNLDKQFDLADAHIRQVCELSFKPPIAVKPFNDQSKGNTRGYFEKETKSMDVEYKAKKATYDASFIVGKGEVAAAVMCAMQKLPRLVKRLVRESSEPLPGKIPAPSTTKEGLKTDALSVATVKSQPKEFALSLQFSDVEMSVPMLIGHMLENQERNDLAVPEMPRLFMNFALKELVELQRVLHRPRGVYEDDLPQQITDIAERLDKLVAKSSKILNGQELKDQFDAVALFEDIQHNISMSQLSGDLKKHMEFLEFRHGADTKLTDQAQKHFIERLGQDVFGLSKHVALASLSGMNDMMTYLFGDMLGKYLIPGGMVVGLLVLLTIIGKYHRRIFIVMGGLPAFVTYYVMDVGGRTYNYIYVQGIKGRVLAAYSGTTAQMRRLFTYLSSNSLPMPADEAAAVAAAAAAVPPPDAAAAAAPTAAAAPPLVRKNSSPKAAAAAAAPLVRKSSSPKAAAAAAPPALARKNSSPKAAAAAAEKPPSPPLARKMTPPKAAAAVAEKPPSPLPLARKNSSPKAAATAAEKPPSPPALARKGSSQKARRSPSPKARRSPSPAAEKPPSPLALAPKNSSPEAAAAAKPPSPKPDARKMTPQEMAIYKREIANEQRKKVKNSALADGSHSKNLLERRATEAESAADAAELAAKSAGGSRTKRRRRANQRKTRKTNR